MKLNYKSSQLSFSYRQNFLKKNLYLGIIQDLPIQKNKLKFILDINYALLLLLAFVLLLTSKSSAQEILWTKTFGGTGDDGAESIVLTSSGEIVIAGFKSSNNLKDVLIMKTDASGNELWNRTYNLGLNDWGRSMKQTQDGGFIIAGMTEVNSQTFDPFLIKTDSEGMMQWYQQYDYGFGDDDRGHAVWQTSDGGYIIAGQTWLIHGAFGNYDMYIIKTDMNGNVQWKKVFYRENEGGDVALAVQQLSDGGYIIGGFTQSSSWASYIIRTDNLGNALWSNIYPGSWQSECYDIQATPDGGFILTGTESSFQTDTDLLIIKLNPNGNLIWKKIYGTVDAEQGEYIQQLQDGGYIIAGMSSHGAGGYDMYVVRTNGAGESLWSKTIGGSGDDRAFSVATAQDGSHLVTGWAWSYGQGMGDVYLVKLQDSVVPVELISFKAETAGADVILNWSTASEINNLGFEIQRKRSGGGNQQSEWILIGFVDGSGTTSETKSYNFTDNNLNPGSYSYRLKQIDFDGTFEYLNEIEVEVFVPIEFSLEQNFPNPFNPSTIIRYSVPDIGESSSLVVLKIYNVLGNEIATLANEEKAAGQYEVEFNAGDFTSGTYFYRLQTGVFTETKKMLLIR
ncbi:MAG TPA: T9SS type A sorting domain-containing protein [Ignavibacteriaceae bacterium]|nr:T9SS type A sorting domain-containing protein [Ignavibacteriaceae bacterium]